MKKILSIKINLWIAITLAILTLGAGFVALLYFRERVYQYNLILPTESKGNIEVEYGARPELSNPDFFNRVRQKFINEKVNFIEVDLSAMKLRLYSEGNAIKEVSILAKGKEGSWWETPAGLYKVESKSKNHFSSFGKVYQPWSLEFQGNFFIHGWPYYPGGEPVASTYSGGCIRLSTDDAKEIYDAVKVGTPVLVYEKDFLGSDDFIYQKKTPELLAQNFLVADLKNNFVFMKKGDDQILPIASLTKLITALVSVEYVNLDKRITITKEMIVGTSKPRLKLGEAIQAYQLLHPLLLESSNEAAVALAEFLGQGYFVNLMNKKTEALGMTNTRFADPAGSSAENVSTPQDLFSLAKYLYANRSFILKLTTGKLTDSAYGQPIFGNLQNFNNFSERSDFVGGKVGKTKEAGDILLLILDLDIEGTKRPIVIALFNSEDIHKDVETILKYIEANY